MSVIPQVAQQIVVRPGILSPKFIIITPWSRGAGDFSVSSCSPPSLWSSSQGWPFQAQAPASVQVSPVPRRPPASLPLSGDLPRAPPPHGFKAGAHLSASEIDVVHEKVQM